MALRLSLRALYAVFLIGIVASGISDAHRTPRLNGTALYAEATIQILTEAESPIRMVNATGPVANPRFELRATGYNSEVAQTNSQPFITATGAQTRPGIIAVSRDLLGSDIPYGSLVRIRDLGGYHDGRHQGYFQSLLDEQDLFIVEDTMHMRKTEQIDVWFEEKSTALTWGVRRVEVELVRYGREGPILAQEQPQVFTARPQLALGY